MTTAQITAENLNDVMEFDHVIRVHPDGSVTEPRNVYGPEAVYDDEVDGSAEWSLMDGYSGQDRYSGPIMHPSEFIGGGLARDILDTPGDYVAIVAYYTPEDYDPEVGEMDAAGWAVAFRPAS